MNVFDCDGAITVGIYPSKNDIIITGRSYEEKPETVKMLKRKGIDNTVFFNPLSFKSKTRKSSGEHKAITLNILKERGIDIELMFEDDPIQWEIIEEKCSWVKIVKIVHDITEKENVKHIED